MGSNLAEGELRWYGHNLSPALKELRLVIISDAHYGNPLFAMNYFKRTVDYVRSNEGVYAMLNGDLCEAAIRTSKGEIFRQVGTPQDQRDWMMGQLGQIKDRILGQTSGNHEDRIMNETGIDISKDIASALGVPYRAEGIMIKIMFGSGANRVSGQKHLFWIYITHGYGGARTKSAKAIKVERVGAWLPKCDLIAMSHDHVVNISPDVDFIPDNRGTIDTETGFMTGKITAHRKILVKTNAYLKSGGYSESLGYPPSDLTTPLIMLLTPESKYWDMLPGKRQKAVRVMV